MRCSISSILFQKNRIVQSIIIFCFIYKDLYEGAFIVDDICLPIRRPLRSSLCFILTIYDYRQVSSLDWLTSYLLSLLFYMITFASTSVWIVYFIDVYERLLVIYRNIQCSYLMLLCSLFPFFLFSVKLSFC